MKHIRFIHVSIFLFSNFLFAEEFIHHLGNNKSEKIIIEVFNGIHVNDSCFKNKEQCSNYIIHKSVKKKKLTNGNAASEYCESNNGEIKILKDKLNNDYEYCVLNSKYFFDSWELFNH